MKASPHSFPLPALLCCGAGLISKLCFRGDLTEKPRFEVRRTPSKRAHVLSELI